MNLLRSQKASQPNISSQSVRYLNELRAIDVLFRQGGMSRADLARALGVTRSTTSSIIANLQEVGLVVEEAGPKRTSAARTGRPGIETRLNPDGAIFVGAAIEDDRLTALTIDLAGAIVRKKSAPFHAARYTPEKAVEALSKLINTLVTAEVDRKRIYGLCVAVPAMLQNGVVLQATLLGWRDVDLRPLIAARLTNEMPITIENDANAFAIAETYFGDSRLADTVALMLIDSGAGGGIVIGGRLLRGGFGLAGEFGHLPVGSDGYIKNRGEPGALETFIGREAVLARYAKQGGKAGAKLSEFLVALESGETAAIRTAQDWAEYLAKGLLLLVNIINPSLVIIGGPVGAILRFGAREIEGHLRSALPVGFPLPKIELSKFGPEGAAYGAALLLHQRAFSIDERALYPDSGARGLFFGVAG
jgi:predicted NBD/HSP70 family sugar kinase